MFEVVRVWSVTNAIYDVTVSAAAGRPGNPSRVLTVKWTRTGPQTWGKGEPTLREIRLPQLAATAPANIRNGRMEADAKTAALDFLTKLDSKKYKAAWDGAATRLRSTTPLEQFGRAMQIAKTIYGPVVDRKHTACFYPATGSSTPAEGAMVMLRFVTITDGGEGIEDVTVRLEPDKVWRVAGYEPKAQVPADRRNLVFPDGKPPLPGDYTHDLAQREGY